MKHPEFHNEASKTTSEDFSYLYIAIPNSHYWADFYVQ